MKREVTRRRKLPAFRVDVGQLEALVDRLTALYAGTHAHQSVIIRVGSEEFDFDTVDEIRKCSDLPSRVTSFTLRLSEGHRRISIGESGMTGSAVSIRTDAETESWCAGAVETAYTFLGAHRQWCWWFRGWPIGALALLSANLYTLSRLVGLKSIMSSPVLAGAWLVSVVALAALYFLRDRLFPLAVLEVRSDETAIRRYMPELTLIVAVLALVLTIIGWFLGK